MAVYYIGQPLSKIFNFNNSNEYIQYISDELLFIKSYIKENYENQNVILNGYNFHFISSNHSYNGRLIYLSKILQRISKPHNIFMIFAEGSKNHKYCKILRQCAIEYGIKILDVKYNKENNSREMIEYA